MLPSFQTAQAVMKPARQPGGSEAQNRMRPSSGLEKRPHLANIIDDGVY